MSAPKDFGEAFCVLELLTEDIVSGEVVGDQVGRAATLWLRANASGSLTLAKAAILAMRHEAGMRGIEGDAEEASATLRALELIEHQIDPPEAENSAPKMPKPVQVPEAIKKQAPNMQGWRLGMVEILAEPGPGGWRLSVSHPERFPYIKELMLARGVTGDVDKTFAAIIPSASAPPRGRGACVVDLVEMATRSTQESGQQ